MAKLYIALENDEYNDCYRQYAGVYRLEDDEVTKFLESYGFKEDEDGYPVDSIYFDLRVIDDDAIGMFDDLVAMAKFERREDDEDEGFYDDDDGIDEEYEASDGECEQGKPVFQMDEFLLAEIRSATQSATRLVNVGTSIADAIGSSGIKFSGGRWFLNEMELDIGSGDFTKSFEDFGIHERATLVNE